MAATTEFIRRSTLIANYMLLGGIALCYGFRFDVCAAVTVYPPWCWTAAGIMLAVLAFARTTRVLAAVAVVLWLVFLFAFADSPTSLLRVVWSPARSERTFRIVSLNCAARVDAMQEVIALQSDIVLFQETPSREELVAVGNTLFGPGNHSCWATDASIVARGEIEIVDVLESQSGNFVHARVRLGDTSIEVICLRLVPSVFRMDLWSPQCWTEFRMNREKRRDQLKIVATYLESIPNDRPLIVGGDFNAPPNDAVFQLLSPRLSDAFSIAGRGWGGTILNEFPAIRIDQLWLSPQVIARNVFTRPSRASDHRMVIGDFQLDD